ncbi:MAG: GAF domain-containing protein [Pseudomonadota bacterium]
MHSPEDYDLLIKQLSAITSDEPNALANLANISAVLFDALDDTNWCGFYLLRDDTLVLGPFQGLTACTRIPMGKGVCGTAAANRQVLRIADVHEFEGHIACDAASESEIVVPLTVGDEVIGVLDIDSPRKDRFSKTDENGLIEVGKLCNAVIANDTASIGLS